MLSVDESLRAAASEWMPSIAENIASDHPPGASIRLERGHPDVVDTTRRPSLLLGGVGAWVDAGDETVRLANDDRTVGGVVDLQSRIARITVPDGVEPAPAGISFLLTIVSAMLLVRDGRTPVHAAAVVDPRRHRAWLLAGDTHSGKSTTTANLMKRGWSYLSDDYVVLSRGEDGGIEAEGWPDDFHLDAGWHRGESTGERMTVREADLPQGMRMAHAALEGVLFTRVSGEEPTVITPIAPVAALERLIRQSPWLVADPKHAGRVFELLTDAASLQCGELRLGRDALADPSRLDGVVRKFAGEGS